MFSLFGAKRPAPPAQIQSLAEGNTAFALDLYSELKRQPGNLFFSPYSISTALAMTYAGAQGETEKQMAQVLHFDQDERKVHAALGELQQHLGEAASQKGIELHIANGLWAQQGHPFRSAFLKIAKECYQAETRQADFETQAERVRHEINHWVAQATKEKIQNILAQGSLNDLTRLVLANAIYFKGLWAKPFDRADSSNQPFHLSPTREASVRLMHHVDSVRYAENSTFQAVELPYQGNQLAMVVLLPRQINGCRDMEDRLTPALLARTLGEMKRREVEIFLPRFKLESGFDLSHTLATMGMTDAFGPKADFSGMDGTRLLFISGVFHKAWGEVDEEGTEAAAATVVCVVGLALEKAPPPPPIFRADHPFIFLIRDTRSGSLLFLGRFSRPA
jgi:serpin B